MIPRFRTNIESGKMRLYNRPQFDKYLEGIEGEYYLVLEKHRNRRSLNQNAYYWGVVIPMTGDKYGYLNKEMHEVWKYQFLQVSDGKFTRVKSTTELDTMQFMEYVDKIKALAATDGLYIPDPNEVTIPKEYEVFVG